MASRVSSPLHLFVEIHFPSKHHSKDIYKPRPRVPPNFPPATQLLHPSVNDFYPNSALLHTPQAELAGYLFHCSNATEGDCMRLCLLGLPLGSLSSMREIGPSTALFLYNFQSKKLHGIFAPNGFAGRDLEPGAWAAALPRKFPAQIRFTRTRVDLSSVRARGAEQMPKAGPLSKGQVVELARDLGAPASEVGGVGGGGGGGGSARPFTEEELFRRKIDAHDWCAYTFEEFCEFYKNPKEEWEKAVWASPCKFRSGCFHGDACKFNHGPPPKRHMLKPAAAKARAAAAGSRVVVGQAAAPRFGQKMPVARSAAEELARSSAAVVPAAAAAAATTTVPAAAGFIFAVVHATLSECLAYGVVGDAAERLPAMVAAIGPETAVFLFNVNDGKVHGVFRPKGRPALNLAPALCGGRFPAQLSFARTAVGGELVAAQALSFRPFPGPVSAGSTAELRAALAKAQEAVLADTSKATALAAAVTVADTTAEWECPGCT